MPGIEPASSYILSQSCNHSDTPSPNHNTPSNFVNGVYCVVYCLLLSAFKEYMFRKAHRPICAHLQTMNLELPITDLVENQPRATRKESRVGYNSVSDHRTCRQPVCVVLWTGVDHAWPYWAL